MNPIKIKNMKELRKIFPMNHIYLNSPTEKQKLIKQQATIATVFNFCILWWWYRLEIDSG